MVDITKLYYKKQEGERSTSLVFVISGGEDKERTFLKNLISDKTFRALRAIFLSKDNQGLQPYQMNQIWREIVKQGVFSNHGKRINLEEMDSVFLLTDVDEYYSQLEKIFKEKPAHANSRWIVSNPCFEIWLYYCYKNAPESDWASLRNLPVSKRSKMMKKMQNNVVAGGLCPIKAFEKMKAGIANSQSYYQEDENGVPLLFSTQMHHFAQYIIEHLGDEYNAFVESNGERRKLMNTDK